MAARFDATADGRRLKFLNVIDEHIRPSLELQDDHEHPLC